MSDAPALFKAIDTSRKRLHRYLHWVEWVTDLASTEQYIKQRITSNLNNACWYGVHVDEKLQGVFGIKYVNTQTHIAELGYWLSDQASGKGVISAAIEAVSKHLSAEYGTRIIEFRILEQNTASIHIAKKFDAQLVERRAFDSISTLSEQQLLIYHAPI